MDLSSLKANPKNPRKVTDKKLKALMKSMKEFGDLGGVIFNRRTQQLIGGHQRISAFKKLGFKQIEMTDATNGFVLLDNGDKFAYREVDWDENREKAANIAANKGAGEWDLLQLGEWFLELKGLDFDLDLTMFDEDERKQFFKDAEQVEGLTDPDEIPEHVDTRCKPGDLWVLGNHRVLCGDSTDVLQVERLMGGEKADIVFTSPPYNVGKTPNGNEQKYLNDQDNQDQQDYCDFITSFVSIYLEYADYIFENVQSVAGNKVALIEHLHRLKEKFADVMIWDKETAEPAMAHRVLNSQFEYIYVFSNEAKRTIGKKDFRGTIPNIFKLNSRAGKEFAKVHKATFRVELPEYFLLNFTEKSCIDPFCGTGTTLIACEKTSRRCFGMELDPKYCDVILARWEKFTGKTATLVTVEDQADDQ